MTKSKRNKKYVPGKGWWPNPEEIQGIRTGKGLVAKSRKNTRNTYREGLVAKSRRNTRNTFTEGLVARCRRNTRNTYKEGQVGKCRRLKRNTYRERAGGQIQKKYEEYVDTRQRSVKMEHRNVRLGHLSGFMGVGGP